MSRRKQTKPFKVEDKEPELRRDRKTKSRRLTRENDGAYFLNSQVSSDTGTEEESSRGKSDTKCDECGKVLASSLSLARHKLTHSENKPFKCPHCNAGFKTSSNMHRHVRIHYRESSKDQSDSEYTTGKSRTVTTNQRSPRQNIAIPNKFREFDVDLAGVGLRSSNTDSQSSNTGSHQQSNGTKKTKEMMLKLPNCMVRIETSPDLRDEESILDSKDTDKEDGMLQSSTKAEDLVCHFCNKSFISRFGLLTHTLSHTENKSNDITSQTKCLLCEENFSSPKALMVHNVIEHEMNGSRTGTKEKKKMLQQMSVMDFSAQKFSFLAEVMCMNPKNGMFLRDAEHLYLCKKCDVTFPLLDALNIHMKNRHKKNSNAENKSFISHLGLTKEDSLTAQKSEEDGLQISNDVDDDRVYTSKLLSVKLIARWLQDEPDLETSSYDHVVNEEACVIYEKKPDYSTDEVLHSTNDSVLSSLNPKNVISEVNPPMRRKIRNQIDSSSILRRFDSSAQTKVDADRSAGEKNVFWCRICNYSSHEKSALVRHLLTHSGIRPYFCKICDYAFTTKANCERHVRKRHNCHTREELDAAVRCDWELLKKAPREDIYMISASNSACPVCQETFASNTDLKQHMKIHEERHFLCQLCGVRCTTRNNCVRHILHKHPGIPHQEANNIITFCGSGPNDLDLDLDVLTTDGIEDTRDVDISKGRLGVRNSSNSMNRWKKSSYQRNFEQLPLKRHLKSGAESMNGDKSEQSDRDKKSPGEDVEEKLMDDETSNAAKVHKPLPLIPLLKIKAYNEAAARSYAEMVALYQHLNFLNPTQANADDIMNVDDNSASAVQSPERLNDGDDMYLASETTFICRTCAKAFDTKDQLQNHIPQCEDDASNVFSMDDGNEDNEEQNVDWNENHDLQSGNEDDKIAVDNSKNGRSLQWYENATGHSPSQLKSADESASNQEYDSAYGSDSKQRTGVYGKEPSYVEDSVLMSMFSEGNNSESDSRSGREMNATSRYSSDLPTMVDLNTATLSSVAYQDGMDGDEKSKNKVYHGRKCPQCNKTFPWASSLRRHIMTHTGLKLYMCRLCKMRFTTRSNLIRHVFRRHGMAKQHPEFASCLAKLNPSDSLLREVEADVRRQIDVKRRRIPGTRNAFERFDTADDEQEDILDDGKKSVKFNNFQSMLEDDPETMLVDLDYSPRDEINGFDENKQTDSNIPENEDQTNSHEPDEEEVEDNELEEESSNQGLDDDQKRSMNEVKSLKVLRSRAETRSRRNAEKTPIKDEKPSTSQNEKKSSPTNLLDKFLRHKQSSHFVCGLCKKIFKTVEELISHLDIHNVPHCWHCPICRVPFTNKYNCQRHLSRRHQRPDMEPSYVEDSRHGPRNARGLPKAARTLDWKSKKMNWHAV